MTKQTNGVSRAHRANNSQGGGPNWLLIAAGTLLSTLSIRLGYQLKQGHDSKQKQNATNIQKGNGELSNTRKSADCFLQSNGYSLTQGTGVMMEIKCTPNGQMLSETDGGLSLGTVPTTAFRKENVVTWASSPDRLELPAKPFHHSNCLGSPCVSESGSDIFSKREVIQKLRQQLKRRDDMIQEMQGQINELQHSLSAQLRLSSHLQLQLDAANKDLFDSEREIQRLQKVIADYSVRHVPPDKSSAITVWQAGTRNNHENGHVVDENNLEPCEKDRIELLKRQVGELKEVIEGKDYLLQSYKEQKVELSLKIRKLRQRLDSQLPNIL